VNKIEINTDMEHEFIQNLILVLIPTSIGIIGSSIFVNNWQIRKEKFALRKEIILSFNDSFPKGNSLLYQLFVKISQEYATSPRDAKMTDTTIEGVWNFPEDEEQQPCAKFSEEFKKIIIETMEIQQKGHNFDGTLRLYFKNTKKMDEVTRQLIDSLQKTTDEIKRLIYSKNLKELMESVNILHPHFTENFLQISKLNNLLVTEKLKTPQESMWDFTFLKKS